MQLIEKSQYKCQYHSLWSADYTWWGSYEVWYLGSHINRLTPSSHLNTNLNYVRVLTSTDVVFLQNNIAFVRKRKGGNLQINVNRMMRVLNEDVKNTKIFIWRFVQFPHGKVEIEILHFLTARWISFDVWSKLIVNEVSSWE